MRSIEHSGKSGRSEVHLILDRLPRTEEDLSFFLRLEGDLLSDHLPPKKIKIHLRSDWFVIG